MPRIISFLSLFFVFELAFAQGHYQMVLFRKSRDFTQKGGTMEIENRHLKRISDLSDDGYIVNAGPMEGGGEMLIFQVQSTGQVHDLLKRELAVAEGLYEYEVLDWTLRYGRICDPSIPYEVTTFSFVRFNQSNAAANYKAREDLEMKLAHQQHMEKILQTGQVMAEGFFDRNEGSVIIYPEHQLDDMINENPAVKKGYLAPDFQIIWLNKGSFCEN